MRDTRGEGAYDGDTQDEASDHAQGFDAATRSECRVEMGDEEDEVLAESFEEVSGRSGRRPREGVISAAARKQPILPNWDFDTATASSL